MYLSQAVSLPPLLRIESDLFQHDSLSQEVQLELALVACSVAVPHGVVISLWHHCNPGSWARERPDLPCVRSLAAAFICNRSWLLSLETQRTRR